MASAVYTGMAKADVAKSYLVRWVKVAGDHTISWSIQPHKKSINFGVFKHPDGQSPTPHLPSSSNFTVPPSPGLKPNGTASTRSAASSRNDVSTATEKLQSIGLKPILWVGKCDADQVSMGKYDVAAAEGGMYALVFDNTFSKQLSKNATFVLLTYPTGAPPQTTHHLHHLRAGSPGAGMSTLASKHSPRLTPRNIESTDSLHATVASNRLPLPPGTPSAINTSSTPLKSSQVPPSSAFYTGVLYKRRRKRHQGYAKRFFSLDFTSSTLSYYHNQRSSALRGDIPLSLAAVGTNQKSREISIDSGAEVWHLRAASAREFEGWREALERASRSASGLTPVAPPSTSRLSALPFSGVDVAEERDWVKIETLVGRIAGTRDAVRRLATTTAPKAIQPDSGLGIATSSADPSPIDSISEEYFRDREKRPFWKRSKSSSTVNTPTLFKRSVSAQRTPVTPTAAPSTSSPGKASQEETGMHDHCLALLHDLDLVVADFSTLIAESKRRRMPVPVSALSHRSVDSSSTGDFFDAEGGETGDSTLLVIPDGGEERVPEEEAILDESDTQSGSDIGSPDRLDQRSTTLFPTRPKNLIPLPLDCIKRRTTVSPPTATPPSLIAFFRKNVGKDLSALSMPVSANEPISLLQRISENLEYSSLLDVAAKPDTSGEMRLLYMTSFAISAFASNRVRERAIRKPFNPILGETFELVREDKGFRFLAEKVSHRPVRMACQAETKDWTWTHSPMPTQKFWGKSAELNTDGRVRVILHPTRERFSWTAATCFLRNIIAGEKYVEPVGTMTVVNETTGEKAVVTFKVGGMFSGRSEDVSVRTYGAHGEELGQGLSGKWTSSLAMTEHGAEQKTLWTAGPLVGDAPARYGFTGFAATLNEITPIERGKLPGTDSRLRPDQRAAEAGAIDQAETIKGQLEEGQRARRARLAEAGAEWVPRWFERIEHGGDEEVWRLKTGRDGYWEERHRGEWSNLTDIFSV